VSSRRLARPGWVAEADTPVQVYPTAASSNSIPRARAGVNPRDDNLSDLGG
jgi:hypothetical protein